MGRTGSEPVSGRLALMPRVMHDVREWQFDQTLIDGKPVESEVDITVEFRSGTSLSRTAVGKFKHKTPLSVSCRNSFRPEAIFLLEARLLWRTKSEYAKLRFGMPVRSCRVSILDMDGIKHSVQVTAETLYEAVALGLVAIREMTG